MNRVTWKMFMCLVAVGACGLSYVHTGQDPDPSSSSKSHEQKRVRVTPQMRKEAAIRKKNSKEVVTKGTPLPGGQPNYFGPEPNYANSPLPVINKKGKLVSKTGMRKFVDSLPGLGKENKNNLGQYIPVAVPDTTTYPGSDYYEIALVEYTQKMHSDLGRTKLRGYVQLNTVPYVQNPVKAAHYMGPTIIAKKNRPVRIKFFNKLPIGLAGNLFLPVDTSVMGAGVGDMPPAMYTQNRAVIHLHGGATPWISDGTPHQWITPAGELTPYIQGVSVQPVPDMFPHPVSGDGTATYFYTNQQSAKLMFFHDHAYGITRLNIYAGEAAPYVITDSVEDSLIAQKVIPSEKGVYKYGIPLVIQDRTYVPPHKQLIKEDPTWNWLTSLGSLWFPHVYMPNQNPQDACVCNDIGRWDYGPWIWPPFNAGAGLQNPPIIDPVTGFLIPATPNPSIVPEAFMDTPVVNGAPYPYLNIDRKAYRFRILNACNDRYLNLQLYYAEPLTVSVLDGGSGYKEAPEVKFKWKDKEKGKDFEKPKAKAILSDGMVVAIEITDPGSGYTTAPKVILKGGKHKKEAHAIASVFTEVKMVPACPDQNFPAYYPSADGRAGGFPDPKNSGPQMVQIGNEGGFLPAPAPIYNRPVGYQYNRRDITALNVLEKALFLGPAERADILIDFSKVPKNVSTLILYNDAPAPVPGFDPRYDYYTNDPDQTDTGGAPSTLAGFGPNTRTVLQFRLSKKEGNSLKLKKLNRVWPNYYKADQQAPIVPETTYPAGYNAPKDTYSQIQDTSLTFTPIGSMSSLTINMLPKAIVESFDLNYGRMAAFLGAELPFTNDGVQTTIALGYRDPPTEILAGNDIQIWKVTHNGIDTHAIHFHLFNVQLINRVGWDGMVKPPDANELGWKETVRMNPLEDVIVALRPVAPLLPFAIPDSIRLFDPTMMPGATWSSFDPLTGGVTTVTNAPNNFGWEYVWHCHLLGHEENDMMRPMVFRPLAAGMPLNVSAVPGPLAGQATVSFSPPLTQGVGPITYTVTSDPDGITATGLTSPITVTGLTSGNSYLFTVTATNSSGQVGPSSFPSGNVVAP